MFRPVANAKVIHFVNVHKCLLPPWAVLTVVNVLIFVVLASQKCCFFRRACVLICIFFGETVYFSLLFRVGERGD